MRRAILVDACCASPIGNSPGAAMQSLIHGRSGIRSLDFLFPEAGSFLSTGAIIEPNEDDPDIPELPRLSPRFSRVLGGFRRRLKAMAVPPVDQLFLICKKPFFSDWMETPEDAFEPGLSIHFFTATLLAGAGLDLPARDIQLVQAACSTGLVALNLAIRALQSRRAHRILLVGVEREFTLQGFLGHRKLGTLSQEKDPTRSCHPFSLSRSGLVPGEVLVGLLLEARDQDEIQSGDIILRAGFSNADAYRLTDGLDTGEFLEACLTRGLADLDLDSIDFLCPHATSTPLNDKLEGAVLDRFFAARSRPLPVVALKQYIGHTMNSCGLWETVLTAEILRANLLPPLLKTDDLEHFPHLDLVRANLERPLSRAVKLTIGFGGINSVLWLEKAS